MSTHSRAGEFCKVGESLYPYSSNGIYYGVFRDKGKLKWKSLRTTEDHRGPPTGHGPGAAFPEKSKKSAGTAALVR